MASCKRKGVEDLPTQAPTTLSHERYELQIEAKFIENFSSPKASEWKSASSPSEPS